jgi:6-methylsalicylate decarboxylase
MINAASRRGRRLDSSPDEFDRGRFELLFSINPIDNILYVLFSGQNSRLANPRMKIDIHQHIWTDALVHALSERRELPFIRHEQGLTVLFLAGERPYVIDLSAESHSRREALIGLDGLDSALICLSSPLGIECLAREQALPLIDAYHEGALALGDPFGVWGAIPLQRADGNDVDRALDLGCVGVSLPAGALASVDSLTRLGAVLERLESRGAPLLVHPGSASPTAAAEASLHDPLWWPALTRYIADVQAAWLAFLIAGRRSHPQLRIIFSMLGGLAPLHHERLEARGGAVPVEPDPLMFYDTSSYGSIAIGQLAAAVGSAQILYGSDRPVVEPRRDLIAAELDWDQLADCTRRALDTRGTALVS